MMTPAIITAQRAPEYSYAVITLDPLSNDTFSFADGVNEFGQVCGTSVYTWLSPMLWTYRGTINLGNIGGVYGEAIGINETGIVVGHANGGDIHAPDVACLWSRYGYLNLGTLGGESSWARAINNHGVAVGYSQPEPGAYRHACAWTRHGILDLGTLLPPYDLSSDAFDINDEGIIVGHSDDKYGTPLPVIWRDGVIEELPVLEPWGYEGRALGINRLGEITGWSNGVNYNYAVVWPGDGTIIDIHDDGMGDQSAGFAINDVGGVVGGISFDDGSYTEYRGFLWRDGIGMIYLDDFWPPNHGDRAIEKGRDINNLGQIVGEYWDYDIDRWRGMLITPVTPTLTLEPPVPGRARETNSITVTGCTPGAQVRFVYGLVGGGSYVAGCDPIDGVAFQMDDPTFVGTATANSEGIATLTRFVPKQAGNFGEILIQAVDTGNCHISQLIVETFE